MQLLPAFPSYISIAHKMLLANKQAHRQNKLSRHVRAIGEAGRGKYKTSSVNKHSEAKKKRPTVGWLVRHGSVTCDSLALLSVDHGCWEDRKAADKFKKRPLPH